MPSSAEYEQDGCPFQLCCSLISQIVPSIHPHQKKQQPKSKGNKIQKHFQNVMLVGMASEISKKYPCVLAIHTLVCGLFACHSYQHNILEVFLYLVSVCIYGTNSTDL